jgi:hypothetical protein
MKPSVSVKRSGETMSVFSSETFHPPFRGGTLKRLERSSSRRLTVAEQVKAARKFAAQSA